ncbi:hypothetical protein [Enterococcus sp. JM9B]|uniref:hypothetical protein n=1 Tax=Enterococcus sp. JM9B TaxID=1857216 RepID=UPI0013753061|nr:hypothetical protein [Enterococcus sp. JM9B]KAF1303704.1 hypothetical protein BAU16_03825 [Enterococcus sp. JM9B]
MEIETIAHLNWIISKLSNVNERQYYIDHEFFDQTIVFTREKAIQMKSDILKKSGNEKSL